MVFVCCRSVRQALLFAVSMVMLSLPSHVIITDLQSEMTETKEWLQGRQLVTRQLLYSASLIGIYRELQLNLSNN